MPRATPGSSPPWGRTCGSRTSSPTCTPTARPRTASTTPHGAFIDGHCACIEAAYREYQLSPDRQFLEKIWPGVKKAVDWLIRSHRSDREGVPARPASEHLRHVASPAPTRSSARSIFRRWPAGERMARLMGDPESAGAGRRYWRRAGRTRTKSSTTASTTSRFPSPSRPGTTTPAATPINSWASGGRTCSTWVTCIRPRASRAPWRRS